MNKGSGLTKGSPGDFFPLPFPPHNSFCDFEGKKKNNILLPLSYFLVYQIETMSSPKQLDKC